MKSLTKCPKRGGDERPCPPPLYDYVSDVYYFTVFTSSIRPLTHSLLLVLHRCFHQVSLLFFTTKENLILFFMFSSYCGSHCDKYLYTLPFFSIQTISITDFFPSFPLCKSFLEAKKCTIDPIPKSHPIILT